MRVAWTFMLALGAVIGLQGQSPSTPPKGRLLTFNAPDPNSPVPGEAFRKLPVQITVTCKLDNTPQSQTMTANGTGFFVGIKSLVVPDRTFFYLVTNRHIAQCWDAQSHPHIVLSVSLRVNVRGGVASTLPLSENGNVAWVFPEDDSVDLAAVPFSNPALLTWDFLALSFDNFATRDTFRTHRIGEGSSVWIPGYFVQFPGERRFQPILRQGMLAMIPDEPMKTPSGKMGTLYLADAHVFGGNSGSPVFATPQDDIVQAGDHWFIGIISGYYFETANAQMEIATTMQGVTQANSGVALIVPADEVKKLLEENAMLKALRSIDAQNNRTPK
jgi:hypothetical protein